ncbi:lamin tail domain-containing protein [Parabacteroides chinchillae]|uniref:Lamin Tail Domain n=1 Tax=Parabacteroides chinchillae TaxID=871327 RepID=A0A8G2BY47_9BACT|nr:lamin tail domain-containing protein [Parabacteroides chinchillae]SEG14175.1 Lamin Tail Domain [Parabacteroides chinchillae]
MRQIIIIIFLFLPFCVFAQLIESFDGPDVNSGNPWVAPKGFFRIDNGLLQFDGSRLTGDFSCYVPVIYSKNMEWQIDVSLSFKSSNSNHARIYVYATDSPASVLYYLQVGHNDHNVSLYRQKGNGTPQRIINGRKDLLGTGASSVKIKLTMENERIWTLYTSVNGNVYKQEGQPFTDNPLSNIRPGGYFNITCRCKASSLKNMVYAFDNIRIISEITSTPTVPEKEPGGQPDDKPSTGTSIPKLLSLAEEDQYSLLLSFDQKVDARKSVFLLDEDKANEVYISDDETMLKPVWVTSRQKAAGYTLTYSGIVAKGRTDECKGNKAFVSTLGNDPDDFENDPDGFEKPSGCFICINEIMADPSGLDVLPRTEYVELYNASATACQLEGWMFVYNDISVKLSSLLLPAGGYVVLYKEGREVKLDPAGNEMPLVKFPAQLANNGKTLQLKSPTGELIDQITYPKAKPGIAWERSGQGLYLSTDSKGGTPGAVNSRPDNPQPPTDLEDTSVNPFEMVFNELLPDPYTGGSEYIELYNRSDRKLSVKGLSIATRKSDGALSTHYPLSSVPFDIEPKGYLLLTKDVEGISSFYLVSSPESLHQQKLPVLANTSSALVLFRTKDEEVIDEVAYSSKWHAPSVKNGKGVSLERIDPDAATQDAANWTSAAETTGSGTPGYRNSQYKTTGTGHPVSVEAPVYSELTGEYTILYYMDKPGYNCRMWVFDTTGRRLAEIANHELLGVEGRLLWNGIGQNGCRPLPGIYILYIELFHPDGTTKSYKRVFLIH